MFTSCQIDGLSEGELSAGQRESFDYMPLGSFIYAVLLFTPGDCGEGDGRCSRRSARQISSIDPALSRPVYPIGLVTGQVRVP